MKNKFLIGILIIASLFAVTHPSRAAFPVRKMPAGAATQQASTTSANNIAGISEAAAPDNAVVPTVKESTVSTEKRSLISRLFHRSKGHGGDAIPKWLYIVLAIFGLGWLGMGINDNFNGSDWLISLLLYILLWLPGFIYTLIKMSNYY